MKCPECRMKHNTHKLDCSKRYKQDETDLLVEGWSITLVGKESNIHIGDEDE